MGKQFNPQYLKEEQLSLQAWADIRKRIKKAMIDRDISNIELGEAIGLSGNYVSSIVSGFIISKPARAKICDYLNIAYIDTKM
jgi:DNA-binding Xre family transcriptional regulator